MSRALRAAALAAAAAFASCSDIVHPHPHSGLDDRIILSAVLDATAARHPVAASPAGYGPDPLLEVIATLYRRTEPQWTPAATAEPVGEEPGDEDQSLCRRARASHLKSHMMLCMIFDAKIEPGEIYKVEVAARGRPTVSGATRAVGDFRLRRAALATGGDSPALSFSWTRSAFAHRYLAGLRRYQTHCHNCSKAWFVDLDSTSYSGPVPQEAVDSAGPNPAVTVMALDRHLHAFLTSGHGWELFGVPPIMNVENGLGFVGSAVVRRLPATVQAGSTPRLERSRP